MNAFAALLLGFPFYLAVKGRLSGYVALAKPSSPVSNGTGEPVASTSSASEKPVQPDNSAAVSSSASSSNADLLSNAGTFAEIAGMFIA
jgi:hypothetical protein